MMTPQEMIDVIKAHEAGQPIQVKVRYTSIDEKWSDINFPAESGFNFIDFEYRVKPKD